MTTQQVEGPDAGEDWAAVGAAVAARTTELRLRQKDVASRSGLSVATLRELTNDPTARRRSGRTLAALSVALEWPPGHLQAVLHGDVPPAPAPADGVRAELDELRADLAAVKARLAALEARTDAPTA